MSMARTGLKVILISALLLVAGCNNSQRDAANYQEGIDAYAKGDFAAALAKFRPLAEKGNAQAQFNMGVMARQGQGVAPDDRQAVDWWMKAAEQGHAEAQDNLGLRLARGQGAAQNWVEADKWFTIAAAGGNQTAANNKKVAEQRMTPAQVADASAAAQAWLENHKK
jgi:TPR repeat protein